MSEENKLVCVLKTAGNGILGCLKTKSAGFYVGLGALVITVVQCIVYGGIAPDIYSGKVILCSVLGIVLFAALSLTVRTSELAPIALMMCDFLSLTSFAAADGIVDYFSTQFFDGFTLGAVFGLPVSVWLSVLCILLSFIAAMVAVFLPQNSRKAEKKNAAAVEQGEIQ